MRGVPHFLLQIVLLASGSMAVFAAAEGELPQAGGGMSGLARMAESHGNPAAAWEFAEKCIASNDAAERRTGYEILLRLSPDRDDVDWQDLERRAREAGVPESRRTLYQAEVALRQGNFSAVLETVNREIASGKLNKEEFTQAHRLQFFARLGLKDYDPAAESAQRWADLEVSPEGRFEARCSQIYVWALAKKSDLAEQLFREVAKLYPGFAVELSDLRMFLDFSSGKWQDFVSRFEEREKHPVRQKPSRWYCFACRGAAARAEQNGENGLAVRLRSEVMNSASSRRERKIAMQELCGTLERGGKWADIAEVIQKFLEWYPESPERDSLERQAARCLGKAGRMDEALVLYDGILSREPAKEGGFRTALEAAELCHAERKSEQELRYLETAVRYAGTDADRQTGYFRLGSFYSGRGESARAEEAFRTASEIPGALQEKALYFRLQELIRMRRYPEARSAALALQNASSQNLKEAANYHLAELYEKTGNAQRAVRGYSVFAKSFPQSKFAPSALYNASLLQEKEGLLTDAVGSLDRFLEIAPKHELAPGVLFKLQRMREQLGLWEEAERNARTLAGEFPESAFAPAGLARLFDRALLENRCKDALNLLDEMEKLPGMDARVKNRILYDRAQVYAKMDDPRSSLEFLNRILTGSASDPITPDAAELAGYLSASLGNYADAAAKYGRAAELRPGGTFAGRCRERQADALFSEGCAKENSALLRQADEIYDGLFEERWKASDAGFAGPLYKEGLCRESEGRSDEAFRRFEKLLYCAADFRARGKEPQTVWCAKALYEAVKIARSRRNLDGAKRALALIALVRGMGLDVNRELETVERELKSKYKL